MIAFRTRAELDMLRAPVVPTVVPRPQAGEDELVYAPALSFPQHASAQQVIDALRQMRPSRNSAYYLFVTDDDERLAGVVSLRHLVVVAPDTRLSLLMNRHVVALRHDASLAEQARILSESGLLALPVVDADGRLVGATNAGELIGAIEAEATEDLYCLAGVSRAETLARPLLPAARDRLLWLLLGLLPTLLVAWMISRFAGVLAQTGALIALLPLVLRQGSSAGGQTLAFVVRSLGLGKVGPRNTRQLYRRELTIGAVNGFGVGLGVGFIAYLWQGSLVLAAIAALALFVNLLVAALAGVLVPFALKALRVDPALTSSLFVPAVSDLCGVACVLGLGALALTLGV